MKLEVLKPFSKYVAGETFYSANNATADKLIEGGFVKQLPDDVAVETKLVLERDEQGNYSTPRVPVSTEKAKDVVVTSDEKGNNVGTAITAKDLIEKINAATTAEEINTLVSADENRATVKDAVSKKLASFS